MTTTITPSAGNAPLMTQQGVGTTPGYGALDLRRMVTGGGELQEGVVGATDYEVVQRGAGANMSVDITMPTGAMALVQGDSVAGQGLYPVPAHASTVNETISANASGNPRVDSVILEVLDNVHDATGSNLARTRVLTGTASGGATLDNRTGAAALPSNALLLADVLVASGAASIANTVIRDRRKWARGAFLSTVYTAADKTTASTTMALIDSTNLNPRFECSGNPIRISLIGKLQLSTTTDNVFFAPFVDGAAVGSQTVPLAQRGAAGAGGEMGIPPARWILTPGAGSHKIGFAWRVTAATATLNAAAATPLIFTVEEILRQNVANNTVTSG